MSSNLWCRIAQAGVFMMFFNQTLIGQGAGSESSGVPAAILKAKSVSYRTVVPMQDYSRSHFPGIRTEATSHS